MIVELSKEDIEKAISDYIKLWLYNVDVEKIEFIRTKKVADLKIKVETKQKGDE